MLRQSRQVEFDEQLYEVADVNPHASGMCWSILPEISGNLQHREDIFFLASFS